MPASTAEALPRSPRFCRVTECRSAEARMLPAGRGTSSDQVDAHRRARACRTSHTEAHARPSYGHRAFRT